jgi:uncharacterized damage-inducible protein DinB
MRPEEIRFLYDYDRWATEKVLAALDGVPHELWSATGEVGERGLGSILVHQLGAAQRWRNGIQQTGEQPEPEDEPLLSIEELRARWRAEWDAVDAWLPTMTRGTLDHVHEGVSVWQMLAHVLNHGTQHRSEAAALLTTANHSPGEIDIIFYIDSLAEAAAGQADLASEPGREDG